MFQDIRYALRGLRLAPGFTLVAVLTLALGIGAATAIFGILNALAASTRPSVSTAGLFTVNTHTTHNARLNRGEYGIRPSAASTLEAHPIPSADISSSGISTGVTLQVPGHAEYVPTLLVPGSFARFFSLQAQTGRWIAPEDDQAGANRVAVISDRLWHSFFGARADVVGHTSVRLNLQTFAIIGIGPVGFRVPGEVLTGSDIFLPLSSLSVLHPDDDRYERMARVQMFLRPKAGVAREQLAAEVRTSLPNLVIAVSHINAKEEVLEPAEAVVEPVSTGGVSGLRETWLSISLATLILIAACANLANLVYARGLHRTGEVAVRASLGASTFRLLRLFVTETAIIATLASTIGLAIAVGAMQLFALAIPVFRLDRFSRIAVALSPDFGVFASAFGAGALAALVVGTATAWRMSRVPPLRVLAASGAGSGLTARGGRTRMVLVAIQITAAVFLVMSAAVALESYQQERSRAIAPVRPLYDEQLLISARVDLERLKYTEVQGRAFFGELIRRARALPGVDAAAITSSLQQGGLNNVETEPPPQGRVGSTSLARVYTTRVSPGYLQTLGVHLTHGRDFTAFDTDGAIKVALISESAVQHLWPHGDDPIGKRVKFGPWDWVTVVGVTSDLVSSIDTGPTRPSNSMFIPFAQWYQPEAVIVARTQTPEATLEPLRLAVNAIDPDVPVFDATTGDDYWRLNRGVGVAFQALMSSLGAIALGIAVLGVYGVVSYFVSTRRREFGIRLALGATHGGVVKLVVDHAIHIVLIGLLPGVFLVSIVSRFAQAQVRAYTPMNITTWFVVPVLIFIAGVIAGYVPARRAARVDPNVALRDL